jgi:AhpC/TSA family
VPRPGNKYAWAVAIVMLMGLGVLLFAQTLPNRGEGLRGPERGSTLRAFAAPSALGNLEGDTNLCQERPCPEQAGPRPACEVVSEEVVNLCQLRRRPLVLTFIFDRGADCYPQVDRTERVRRELDGVTFATVFFTHKEREEIRELVEARGWQQPIAVDSDGEVANMYGIGGCPTTVFTRTGGRVADTELGNLTEEQLQRKAERLLG